MRLTTRPTRPLYNDGLYSLCIDITDAYLVSNNHNTCMRRQQCILGNFFRSPVSCQCIKKAKEGSSLAKVRFCLILSLRESLPKGPYPLEARTGLIMLPFLLLALGQYFLDEKKLQCSFKGQNQGL